VADIRKNLILSAKLDDSELKKQLALMKKELGSSFSVDGGTMNELKSAVKEIGKEFGAQLKKELEGIRVPRGKAGAGQPASSNSKQDFNLSGINSIHVKEMFVANMVVQNMGGSPASGGTGGGGSGGTPSAGGSGFFSQNRGFLKALGGGATVVQGIQSYLDIRQTMAERENRFSRDLDAGFGVEGIARESGRNKYGLAGAAGVGGALAGGALGMKGGAALGSFLGPLGALIGGAVGGVGGAAIGGLSSFFGVSNAQGELSKEQVQLLSDAEQRARALSPMRQQLMAGGGISPDVMTDQMMIGAKAYGMSGDQTLQAMLQARQFLGNRGASESFDQIMGNQRFLGIDAGTTASAIETMAGASGMSRGSAAQAQAEVIKKGVAAGLDVSKSGKMLQTMDQFVQGAVGLGRLDTDQAGTQIASLAQGFGGGNVTDITMRQAQSYADMLRQQSSSVEGLAGAANIMGIQQIGASAGGFGTGTTLALSKLQSNATSEDIESILAEGQRTGEVGKNADIATIVKQVQAFKQQDQAMALADRMIGDKNTASFIMTQERGTTMQDELAARRAQAGVITPQAMAGAAGQIADAKGQVQGSQEFKLDVASFSRNAESASQGLKNFGTIAEQMTAQMTKMISDLKVAQDRFNEMSAATGYGASSYQPVRASGR
jgi:hypothetical protein